MAKRRSKSHKPERRITVRGVRRDPPDIEKLCKVLIALARTEAEREAQVKQAARTERSEDTPDTPTQTGGDLED
ncbi:hypothetical protein OG320_24120 [Microbispora sp. NBC_01189]|uniref:hypothetical protein n=1 Tax=Microbispora sp. NBC_01189 TaxID=2903583 RepID=UPI002E0D6A79|nr:hypothetical protein OG320_24120 [Microbispora sp. NBC_01189]